MKIRWKKHCSIHQVGAIDPVLETLNETNSILSNGSGLILQVHCMLLAIQAPGDWRRPTGVPEISHIPRVGPCRGWCKNGLLLGWIPLLPTPEVGSNSGKGVQLSEYDWCWRRCRHCNPLIFLAWTRNMSLHKCLYFVILTRSCLQATSVAFQLHLVAPTGVAVQRQCCFRRRRKKANLWNYFLDRNVSRSPETEWQNLSFLHFHDFHDFHGFYWIFRFWGATRANLQVSKYNSVRLQLIRKSYVSAFYKIQNFENRPNGCREFWK